MLEHAWNETGPRFKAWLAALLLLIGIGSRIELVPLAEGTGRPRTVPPESDVLVTARQLGVCFGDEEPETFDSMVPPPPPSLPPFRSLKPPA